MLNICCKISFLFDESVWCGRIDDARSMDAQILNDSIDSLQANSSKLEETLSIFCRITLSLICFSSSHNPGSELQENDMTPIIVCLQRQLENRSIGGREQQFFSHVLVYLNSCTGSQIDTENWMITSYEVDFGQRIGVGGLYELMPESTGALLIFDASGEVYRGIWNKAQVAIKVLKSHCGVKPSPMVR